MNRPQRFEPPPIGHVIDGVYGDWPAGRAPGFVLSVLEADGPIAQRVHGFADLEGAVRLTADTVFNLNCLSKPFIGMAVALVELEGRIHPDDPVRRHLPELSARFDEIRLGHLIHHTSGLRDLSHLLWVCGGGDLTTEQVDALVGRQTELLSKPGARFLYSRTGYFLLCRVLSRVVGGDLSAWFGANIFEPLGMSATYLAEERASIRGGHARGYLADAGAYSDVPARNHYVDIGVYSTLRDLCRWERHAPGRLGRTLVERCLSCGVLNNGAAVPYAYGVSVWSHANQTVVSHAARDNGLSHVYMRLPAAGCSFVMLSNYGDADAELRAMRTIDGLFDTNLARLFGAPAARPATGTGEEAQRGAREGPVLKRCAGRYYSPELDASYDVRLRHGGLSLQCGRTVVPLTCIRPGEFRGRTITVTFPLHDDRRRPTSLVISSNHLGRIHCVRTAIGAS